MKIYKLLLCCAICILILFLQGCSNEKEKVITQKNTQPTTQNAAVTLTPEEWLKANQDILDNLMQNQIRLGNVNQHYLYLVNSGDVRVFGKILAIAQGTQQKLNYKCTNEDTENLRLLIDKELSRQIEVSEYTKMCVSSKKAESEYKNGLKNRAEQGILNANAPLDKLLKKYNINTEGLFQKAYKVVENERY